MVQKIKSIPGMQDITSQQMAFWHKMETTAREVFGAYGFSEIRTPLLEDTQLFARGIGEETQVVSKEMYTFEDRGGDSVTLRPEGTAGVVRAFVQHSFHAKDAISKLYYMGPMFRYERPQKGRLRQFHQIGAELMGVDTPLADAEVVILLDRWVQKLGVGDYRLEVNSLGTPEERESYLEKLVSYFKEHATELGADDQERLTKNPLRILDSKDPKAIALREKAPRLLESLGDESKAEFDSFLSTLKEAGVNYHINPFIVRGLDYYQKTTFEFISDALGSQSAFAGGGRYNQLVEELGGPLTPCVGFAAGCERLVMLMEEHSQQTESFKPGAYFIPMTEAAFEKCRSLMQIVRDAGVCGEMDYYLKSMKSQMRRANKLKYQFAVILGDDELAAEQVMVKNLEDGQQKAVAWSDLVAAVQS